MKMYSFIFIYWRVRMNLRMVQCIEMHDNGRFVVLTASRLQTPNTNGISKAEKMVKRKKKNTLLGPGTSQKHQWSYHTPQLPPVKLGFRNPARMLFSTLQQLAVHIPNICLGPFSLVLTCLLGNQLARKQLASHVQFDLILWKISYYRVIDLCCWIAKDNLRTSDNSTHGKIVSHFQTDYLWNSLFIKSCILAKMVFEDSMSYSDIPC